MQEVKCRVVIKKKKLRELCLNDKLVDRNGDVWEIETIDNDGAGVPLKLFNKDSESDWFGTEGLKDFEILNLNGTYNVMDLVSEPATCLHTEIRMGADNAVAGIAFEGETFIRQTAEPEPAPPPTPETRIIPIDGVKHVITRKPDGKWGEPVLWEPQVGDEVELVELKEGDRVLIEGFITEFDCNGDARVQFGDLNKYYRPTQKAIYNGRSES